MKYYINIKKAQISKEKYNPSSPAPHIAKSITKNKAKKSVINNNKGYNQSEKKKLYPDTNG